MSKSFLPGPTNKKLQEDSRLPFAAQPKTVSKVAGRVLDPFEEIELPFINKVTLVCAMANSQESRTALQVLNYIFS